jgi:hypothetical protein
LFVFPCPRFAPHALTAVRRRLPSASPCGSPLPSPARLSEYHRSIPCVASFALAQTLSQTEPLALDRVGSPELPARRRSPAGFQSPVRRRRAVRFHRRPIWIGRSRSIPFRGQTSLCRSNPTRPRLFARNPPCFLRFTSRSFHRIVFSRIGPVFFVLAQKV